MEAGSEALDQDHALGVEIGAGTAWLSAIISQRPSVEHISAIELDPKRLELAQKYFLKEFNGQADKISYLPGDFHHLPFLDASLDFVVCDAALHHTNELEKLLTEIHRVLKPVASFTISPRAY